MPEKVLYLVDGHALAYRSHFAFIRNPLSNSQGHPTSAIYGLTNYLLRLKKEYKCPYLAVVFDSPVPTFREAIYAEYKANREEMPSDLKLQMPLLFKLVEYLNISHIRQDGLEADDIIATLTRRAEAQGFKVFIVTRDKDLMQLVSDNVHMLAPETGGGLEEFDARKVKEKMGVEPSMIRDLLTLTGDASDNIPGVMGVGPKTAVKILETAGSLDALIANPDVLKNPKLIAKIKEYHDAIILSRKLVTLKDDAELSMGIEDFVSKDPHKQECIDFFKSMDFGGFLKDPLFDTHEMLESHAKVVGSLWELTIIMEEIKKCGYVSIDTETTSINPREASLVGISLAVNEHAAWYVPVGHDAGQNLPVKEVLDTLQPVLASSEIKKIGQNLKYDYQVFKNHGYFLAGISFDTMVAAYLIDSSRRQLNLGALASHWLNLNTIPIEKLIGTGKNQISFSSVSIADAAKYSGEDAVLPLQLKNIFMPLLKERQCFELFDTIEMPLVTVLAEMEWAGIALDCALLKTLSIEHQAHVQSLIKDIYQYAGCEFNLNSPKQISEILFDKLELSKSKKTKTGLSTDVDALEKLSSEHPIVPLILDYREDQKLLSTYIDALPLAVNAKTGRVHTSFNQTITATGRLSSTEPNLQNIPVRTEAGKRIREAFVAPDGFRLISADYSQIELRILAHLSNDSVLVEAFHQDKDIHTQTASAIYNVFPEMVTSEMRRNAKTINFGLMYGMGPINLSRQLGISFTEARDFIDRYFVQFPSIHAFMDSCIASAGKNGYSETLLGRRRYLPDINSSNRQVREAAERTAINTPVQGTAADIIKIAMVNAAKELPVIFPRATMLLQVHDELVFEVDESRAESFAVWIAKIMADAFKLSVPVKVDVGIGINWSIAH
jgi:DNA polymerase-1